MLLFIDTSDNRIIRLKLGDKTVIKKYPTPKTQELLAEIDRLLKREGKSQKELTEIKVKTGPGSFTSLRVGIAVANALGFALGIPINGSMAPVVPRYGKPPNITTPKS